MRQVATAGEGSAERDLERLKLGTRSLIWNDAQSGSFVALPLLLGGEVAGILILYATQRDFFDEEEMRLLRACGRHRLRAISRRRRAWTTSPTTTRSPIFPTAACSPTG